jgi:hypothetical protein
MRAAILLSGMAIAFSVMAGEEIQYDVTGLPQLESPVKAKASQPIKAPAVRVTKESSVREGSLESFGATGLGQ